MDRVLVTEGQTLLDIAVQATGSIEALLDIAVANDISITDYLKASNSLVAPQVINRTVADYFRVNGIIPKTGIRHEDAINAPFGGVGYMGIGIDFIVS